LFLRGSGDWLGWMRLQYSIPHPSADFIVRILQSAREYGSVTELCDRLEMPSRTVRYHLEKDGLPKAEQWFIGSRLLNAQLQLLRQPDLGVAVVAESLGYRDPVTFSRQISRLFGVTVDLSRSLLGLEWRFRAWLAWAQKKSRL
jgi:AraC-like DNA-binding protein